MPLVQNQTDPLEDVQDFVDYAVVVEDYPTQKQDMRNIDTQCEFCQSSYSSIASKKRHIKEVHLKKKVQCEYCQVFLGNKRSKIRHVNAVHFKIQNTKVQC